jgi:hypothetical protein
MIKTYVIDLNVEKCCPLNHDCECQSAKDDINIYFLICTGNLNARPDWCPLVDDMGDISAV